MWGRLAACAAVGYRRSVVQDRRLADGHRLQLTKLPHIHLRSDSSRFLMNRLGLHFYVAHPVSLRQMHLKIYRSML
jgi:hypothetical protein